jgi:hypothetical protein
LTIAGVATGVARRSMMLGDEVGPVAVADPHAGVEGVVLEIE